MEIVGEKDRIFSAICSVLYNKFSPTPFEKTIVEIEILFNVFFLITLAIPFNETLWHCVVTLSL